MAPYWRIVDDIMGGAPTMRAAKEAYLPRFEKESQTEYDQRVATAPFTPLYADAFRNLASKPFSQQVKLEQDASDDFRAIEDDVDMAGNHLHVFARDVFGAGINYGVDWILVDKDQAPAAVSRADEARAKVRPYWVRIPAKRMLASYQDMVDGQLVTVHARIDETVRRRDGWGEVTVRRVRVLDREPIPDEADNIIGYARATFQVWEQQDKPAGPAQPAGKTWELVEAGEIAIGEIALIPFVTGEHDAGSWKVRPPLRDLAHMQITEFQMESNRNRVQTMTAFPVNVIQGVKAPEREEDREIPMGPRTVLWFEPIGDSGSYGDFRREEPSGAAGTMLREDLLEFRKEMREAGMQPLTPQSGNLTATATAVAEAKAHSAVEMWALALKDALEQAFVYTAKWLDIDPDQAPRVIVHTDFSIGQQSTEEMAIIKDLHQDALISGEQRIEEAVRRNILGPTYDRNADQERILREVPGDDDLRDAITP